MLRSIRLAQILALGIVAAAPASADAARMRVDHDGVTPAPRFGAKASIVGGSETDIAATPWLAAILTSQKVAPGRSGLDRQFCGGALVAPRLVLTAAHCFKDKLAQNVEVTLGRSNLDATDGTVYDVAQIVRAPIWNPDTLHGDAAVLVLAQPATATPLAAVGADVPLRDGQMAMAIGWGDLGGGNYPSQLHSTPVPLVSGQRCAQQYADFSFSPDPRTNVCAGWSEGGRNTCKGDSGGPLVVRDAAGAWRQAGIDSWADGCALANRPTVFTFAGASFVNQLVAAVMASLGDAAAEPAATGVTPPAATTTVAAGGPRVSNVRLVVRRSGRRTRLQLRFQVGEPARIAVQIQRRVRGRYVAATRSVSLRRGAGRHDVRLSSRMPRGSYRLVLQVTNQAAATTVVAAPFRLSR